jgi:hypothetical protein
MSKYLTKDLILAADDLKTIEVKVPEWGGAVLIRGMTGADRDDYESSVISQNGKDVKVNYENMRAKLVAKCIVDEEGKRVFTDADVAVLSKKSAVAINRVFEAAQKLCGIGANDISDLIKN